MAKAMGLDYYTMISQIERGITRIPPDRMETYARLLGMDQFDFWFTTAKWYDPFGYKIVAAKLRK